jgi:RHS repeat-associated protein
LPITYNADYYTDLQPTNVIEASAGVTRTTTTNYDALGRITGTQLAVAGTGASNETLTTTISYNPTTGLPFSVSDGTNTVTTTTDTWGRGWTSTDAAGLEAFTTYTTDGAVATFNDGRSIYTYTYDQPAGERRNLLTSVDLDLPAGTNDILAIKRDARGQIAEIAYPNGMSATHSYTELGVPTALSYTASVGGVPTELVGFTATTDIDGRALGYSSPASTQGFGYDSIGRLTTVEDTRQGACTTRAYGFSQASERTSLTTYAPASGDATTGDGAGACQTTANATAKTNTYDAANRITNDGYTYDLLGRTLTIPGADTNSGTGAGPLHVTYHANDMVASMTQEIQATAADGTTTIRTDSRSYTLDPTGRVMTIMSTVDGSETSRTRYEYPDAGDNPSYVSTTTDGGQTWVPQRNVAIAGLGMIATVDAQSINWQLTNLHGDFVAAVNVPADSGIESYAETDEYGRPADGICDQRRYGYIGTRQRPAGADTLGAITLMGARIYNPATGSFLTVDPVLGGNDTPYAYPNDPVNRSDPSGMFAVAYSTHTRTSYSSWAYRVYNSWEAAFRGEWVGGFNGYLLDKYFGAATWMGTLIKIGMRARYVTKSYRQYGYHKGVWSTRMKYVTYEQTQPFAQYRAKIWLRWRYGKYPILTYPQRVTMRLGSPTYGPIRWA